MLPANDGQYGGTNILCPSLRRGIHDDRHVSWLVAVLIHQLVGLTYLPEAENAGEQGIDAPRRHQIIQPSTLLNVGEVRPLESLLAHPKIPKVHISVVTRRSGAANYHPCVVADEERSGNCSLAWMFNNDPGCATVAEHIRELPAELPGAIYPISVRIGIADVRETAPMTKL